VLTTNRPDLMDSALLRALRATPVVFRRPDAPRTRQLFELYLRDKPCADVDAELLAREAARAVFADREPLAQLVLRNSSRLPVMRSDAVSGALVRAACEDAQSLAFVRQARAGGRGRPRGILRDDLFAALDEQFARVAEHLTRDNVEMSLTLPTDAVGNVVAVERQRPSERHRFLLDPDPQPRRPQAAAAAS
jgi:SpoVK/Ycf46/Vps4 family AAA+-type ATPase